MVSAGSSFAWTLGHLSNSVDSWINVRVKGRRPHPVIGGANFRFGGTGAANNWQAVQSGTREVRDSARHYLPSLKEDDLDLVIPYDGSVVALHANGLCLRDVLDVIINLHYFHIGEIAAKRQMLGHHIDDLPRPIWEFR